MKNWIITGAALFFVIVTIGTCTKNHWNSEATDISCYEWVSHIKNLSDGKLYTATQKFYKSKLPEINKYTSDGMISVFECAKVQKIIQDDSGAEKYYRELEIKKEALN